MKLVNIADHGIKGKLYYIQANNLSKFGVSTQELADIGIYDDAVYIDIHVAQELVQINNQLLGENLELIIKDGYRSSELYDLVYRKRCEIYGADATDAILNMTRKIHASGLAIDVSLVNIYTGIELPTKYGSHGEAVKYGQEQYIRDFFQNSNDLEEILMHQNRLKLRDLMYAHGFVYGTVGEYWHFEYISNSNQNI